jgi:hypothetical protein
MCGGGAPTQPTVDPAAERQKAADEAARKANASIVSDRRRTRGQKGLLSGEYGAGMSVLSRAAQGQADTRSALSKYA